MRLKRSQHKNLHRIKGRIAKAFLGFSVFIQPSEHLIAIGVEA